MAVPSFRFPWLVLGLAFGLSPAFAALTPLPNQIPAAVADVQDTQVPDRVRFGDGLIGGREGAETTLGLAPRALAPGAVGGQLVCQRPLGSCIGCFWLDTGCFPFEIHLLLI